jgi:hypothetical protein
MQATYSPDDNKLRLYSMSRLVSETYARVRAAGFVWAPQQGFFVAPMWTPEREDLLLELCGEIEDEDSTLVERAEDRAERFEEFAERRLEDAERAQAAVSAIADNILCFAIILADRLFGVSGLFPISMSRPLRAKSNGTVSAKAPNPTLADRTCMQHGLEWAEMG